MVDNTKQNGHNCLDVASIHTNGKKSLSFSRQRLMPMTGYKVPSGYVPFVVPGLICIPGQQIKPYFKAPSVVNNGSTPKSKTSNASQDRSIFYGTGPQNDYTCIFLSKFRLT